MIKDFRYIYNIKQANFYIDNNMFPIETGRNDKTGNIYYKFKNSKELQNVFAKWGDNN